jgi:hypothetical protein
MEIHSDWRTLFMIYIRTGGLPEDKINHERLHPPVASDGGVCVSQVSVKILDLVLSGQQTSAQLHRHILVVYHLHPGDIPFHPVGLELILLPVG